MVGIDVLRGIAALAVFVFHVQFMAGFEKRTLPPIEVNGRTVVLPNVLSLGASGVTLFFILSGLCLSLEPLRRAARGRHPLDARVYFRNRVARVYPAYALAVLTSAALAMATSSLSARDTLTQTVVHLAFVHAASGEWILSLNGALWSMATEVQFYLAYPLLLASFVRLGPKRFLLAAMLSTLAYRVAITMLPCAASIQGSVTLEALLAMLLPGRLAEFALGMYLAELHVARRSPAPSVWLKRLGVSLPVALLIRARGPSALAEFALAVAYVNIVALVLLAPSTSHGTVRTRLLDTAASFGHASYSFFLFHTPVCELLGFLFVFDKPTGSYVTLLKLLAV
ncbi:MAG: acyltransferase [Deltaproteobacteria bacterium]|nr:acyltransferase [Deltaproteobacteria bacterium]